MHCVRRADSRADCTAGNSSDTSTPMIAITTSNSTSVNPGRVLERLLIWARLPEAKIDEPRRGTKGPTAAIPQWRSIIERGQTDLRRDNSPAACQRAILSPDTTFRQRKVGPPVQSE